MTDMRRRIGSGAWVLVTVTLLVVAGSAPAQEGGHGRSIDEIEREIVSAQGASSIDAVDPDGVSPSLLEELGDSVMAEMIDDEEQHEWMDEMMGGEDSAQLAAMHRWIGYNYIESDGELVEQSWGPGMMGFGMMGPGMMGSWGWNADWRDSGWGHGSMMGWWSPWSWIIGIIVIALIVVGIVFLVRRRGSGSRDPLDILRRRYANGEISREEFERMRDDLR